MRKALAWLSAILALASGAGVVVLTLRIQAGEQQIAQGQRQLDAGRPQIEEGKAALAAGKQQSAAGKKEYERAKDNVFLVLADKLFGGGRGFKEAKARIDTGDQQIAEGESRIGEGEKSWAAGELELQQGREWLRLAKSGRLACASGFAVFAPVAIWLGIRWKRTRVRPEQRSTDARLR